MRNEDFFKNKKITVVGLARSGLACANLLYDLGADVFITDNKDNEATRASLAKLRSKNIKVELGGHTQECIRDRDLVVISPGVVDTALPVVWAGQSGIPAISEIEFAWMLCPGRVIAVTGSNGKTTVTTLIGKILEAWGKRVFVCGNIGNPFSAEVGRIKDGDFVSLEVSSFQLEKISKFKPEIAVILNLSRNHLDRHKDMQEYLDAKKRIFMNQDSSDYLVLNQQDPVISALGKEARSKVIYFSQTQKLNPNQAAVLEVGSILGIDKGLVLRVFAEFGGVEHRMEKVGEINNVKFINDSKATTAESTLWALESISCPVILIAGGRHKGIDYRVILEKAKKKVKKAILIGEASRIIKDALSGDLPVEEAKTLEEAVDNAFKSAKPGDCVLLSPMCSSFDMFRDYEERGRVFKEIVNNLARGSN